MPDSTQDTQFPSADPLEPKPPPPLVEHEWRGRLLAAKASGADDASAAEYAGISQTRFDEEVATDPTLERDMLAARAGALLKHLKAIEDASQWQAHVYALENLWAEKFADQDKPQPAKSITHEPLRAVVREMQTGQLPRMANLLQNGINQDNAENPPPPRLPCLTNETSSTKS